jgi:hypothetical protein
VTTDEVFDVAAGRSLFRLQQLAGKSVQRGGTRMNVHVFSKDTDHFTASGFAAYNAESASAKSCDGSCRYGRFKIAAPIEVLTSIRKFLQMTGRHNYAKRSQAFP